VGGGAIRSSGEAIWPEDKTILSEGKTILPEDRDTLAAATFP
jgi:hypothetical protein